MLVGYIDIDLNISGLRDPTRIVNVEVKLIQTWEVSSLEDAGQVHKHPPAVFSLWSLKKDSNRADEVQRIMAAGDDFHLQKRVLLPDDTNIRASTAKRSKTGLRASHELEILMTYVSLSATEPEDRPCRVQMKVPALLHACDCVIEARQLPIYEQHAHNDAARLPFVACDQRARCRECILASSVDRH